MVSDAITINSIEKVFSNNGHNGNGATLPVLSNISLSIKEGELFCLLGPSGCGKSTLLRIVAGLETQTKGSVQIYGDNVANARGTLGMVFQEPTLFPWRTVEGNVCFGLEEKGLPKQERQEKSGQYIELVGLKGFEDHYPQQLSGGMKQRAALATTLVNEPKVLLLDEPFGALDALTRLVMQQELLRILEKTRLTVILVTHSIDEAIFLSDRISVVSQRPGRIEETISVDIPRPRERTSPAFTALSREIFNMIVGQQNNSNGCSNGKVKSCQPALSAN